MAITDLLRRATGAAVSSANPLLSLGINLGKRLNLKKVGKGAQAVAETLIPETVERVRRAETPTQQIVAGASILPGVAQEVIVQPAARLAAGFGLSATERKAFVPKGKITKALLGKEEVKPFQETVQEGINLGRRFGEMIGPRDQTSFGGQFITQGLGLTGALLFGGLEAGGADIGVGGVGKKAARKTIEKSAEKITKRAGEEVLEKTAERLLPKIGDIVEHEGRNFTVTSIEKDGTIKGLVSSQFDELPVVKMKTTRGELPTPKEIKEGIETSKKIEKEIKIKTPTTGEALPLKTPPQTSTGITGIIPEDTGAKLTIPLEPISPTTPVTLRPIIAQFDAMPTTLRERGFVTSAKEVLPEATKISGFYVPRDTDTLSLKAANFIKDNVKAAERLALEGTDERAVATASELLKHYAKLADGVKDEAAKNALYDKAAEIANTVATKLTESGRTVQAASILARLTPEGQIRFVAKEIQKYNKLNPKKRIAELTGEQAKRITEEMRVIQRLPEGTEKAMRFSALQKEIRSYVPSTVLEKVTAIWKAGLLTGFKTTGVNIFSNLSHAALERIKDIPAAAADRLLSLLTGRRTVTATYKGLPEGLREGANKGWRFLKTGYDERRTLDKLDFRQVNFKHPLVQKYVDTVFSVLGAEDQPFYYGALRHSLYSQGLAEAKNKGLKGSAAEKFARMLAENPTSEMSLNAVADAETAVFQNKTILGEVGKKLQQVRGGEFFVPFARTPSSVAMQVLNYSPVGIVKEAIIQIKHGSLDQRVLSQAIGRSVVGIVPLVIGSELYKNGLISLDRPKQEREREEWKTAGKSANSVKLGDSWRTIQILGPAGNLLLLGAHFRKALEKTGSPTGAMQTAFFGAIKSFTEQTFLKGVNDVIGAITDPERNAEYMASSFVSSFIPTILNDVARAIDPKERRPETIMQRVLSRIPILRQKLEPQVSVLGKEIERGGNPLETILDPTRPSKGITSPTIEELQRLTKAGFNVSPTLLGDKKGYGVLTQEENTKLWKLAGKITNDKLTSLFSRDEYQTLDDAGKAKLAEKIIDQSKTIARVGMIIEKTKNLHGEDLKKELSRLKAGKLMSEEVFKQYLKFR